MKVEHLNYSAIACAYPAGGIGIAPLYSMLSYAWELQANSAERQRVLLLYSARHPSNFAMASDIDALARVAGPEKFQVLHVCVWLPMAADMSGQA